ncbi:MAG: hypothetical protein J0H54_04470 [Rhizobiales bacterium]|nr:hypothetical protein [Hyphomicrobiales bacterium]
MIAAEPSIARRSELPSAFTSTAKTASVSAASPVTASVPMLLPGLMTAPTPVVTSPATLPLPESLAAPSTVTIAPRAVFTLRDAPDRTEAPFA